MSKTNDGLETGGGGQSGDSTDADDIIEDVDMKVDSKEKPDRDDVKKKRRKRAVDLKTVDQIFEEPGHINDEDDDVRNSSANERGVDCMASLVDVKMSSVLQVHEDNMQVNNPQGMMKEVSETNEAKNDGGIDDTKEIKIATKRLDSIESASIGLREAEREVHSSTIGLNKVHIFETPFPVRKKRLGTSSVTIPRQGVRSAESAKSKIASTLKSGFSGTGSRSMSESPELTWSVCMETPSLTVLDAGRSWQASNAGRTGIIGGTVSVTKSDGGRSTGRRPARKLVWSVGKSPTDDHFGGDEDPIPDAANFTPLLRAKTGRAVIQGGDDEDEINLFSPDLFGSKKVRRDLDVIETEDIRSATGTSGVIHGNADSGKRPRDADSIEEVKENLEDCDAQPRRRRRLFESAISLPSALLHANIDEDIDTDFGCGDSAPFIPHYDSDSLAFQFSTECSGNSIQVSGRSYKSDDGGESPAKGRIPITGIVKKKGKRKREGNRRRSTPGALGYGLATPKLSTGRISDMLDGTVGALQAANTALNAAESPTGDQNAVQKSPLSSLAIPASTQSRTPKVKVTVGERPKDLDRRDKLGRGQSQRSAGVLRELQHRSIAGSEMKAVSPFQLIPMPSDNLDNQPKDAIPSRNGSLEQKEVVLTVGQSDLENARRAADEIPVTPPKNEAKEIDTAINVSEADMQNSVIEGDSGKAAASDIVSVESEVVDNTNIQHSDLIDESSVAFVGLNDARVCDVNPALTVRLPGGDELIVQEDAIISVEADLKIDAQTENLVDAAPVASFIDVSAIQTGLNQEVTIKENPPIGSAPFCLEKKASEHVIADVVDQMDISPLSPSYGEACRVTVNCEVVCGHENKVRVVEQVSTLELCGTVTYSGEAKAAEDDQSKANLQEQYSFDQSLTANQDNTNAIVDLNHFGEASFPKQINDEDTDEDSFVMATCPIPMASISEDFCDAIPEVGVKNVVMKHGDEDGRDATCVNEAGDSNNEENGFSQESLSSIDTTIGLPRFKFYKRYASPPSDEAQRLAAAILGVEDTSMDGNARYIRLLPTRSKVAAKSLRDLLNEAASARKESDAQRQDSDHPKINHSPAFSEKALLDETRLKGWNFSATNESNSSCHRASAANGHQYSVSEHFGSTRAADAHTNMDIFATGRAAVTRIEDKSGIGFLRDLNVASNDAVIADCVHTAGGSTTDDDNVHQVDNLVANECGERKKIRETCTVQPDVNMDISADDLLKSDHPGHKAEQQTPIKLVRAEAKMDTEGPSPPIVAEAAVAASGSVIEEPDESSFVEPTNENTLGHQMDTFATEPTHMDQIEGVAPATIFAGDEKLIQSKTASNSQANDSNTHSSISIPKTETGVLRHGLTREFSFDISPLLEEETCAPSKELSSEEAQTPNLKIIKLPESAINTDHEKRVSNESPDHGDEALQPSVNGINEDPTKIPSGTSDFLMEPTGTPSYGEIEGIKVLQGEDGTTEKVVRDSDGQFAKNLMGASPAIQTGGFRFASRAAMSPMSDSQLDTAKVLFKNVNSDTSVEKLTLNDEATVFVGFRCGKDQKPMAAVSASAFEMAKLRLDPDSGSETTSDTSVKQPTLDDAAAGYVGFSFGKDRKPMAAISASALEMAKLRLDPDSGSETPSSRGFKEPTLDDAAAGYVGFRFGKDKKPMAAISASDLEKAKLRLDPDITPDGLSLDILSKQDRISTSFREEQLMATDADNLDENGYSTSTTLQSVGLNQKTISSTTTYPKVAGFALPQKSVKFGSQSTPTPVKNLKRMGLGRTPLLNSMSPRYTPATPSPSTRTPSLNRPFKLTVSKKHKSTSDALNLAASSASIVTSLRNVAHAQQVSATQIAPERIGQRKISLRQRFDSPLRQRTVEEAIQIGVPREAVEMTPKKALEYRFAIQLDDGEPTSWGPDEARLEMLESVKYPKELTPEWVENHYRWIVWKLASMVRSFPSLVSSHWNQKMVKQQLNYRFEREHQAQRSAVKLIIEGDDSPTYTLILCISEIREMSSDGWYPIRADIDDALTEAINAKKIFQHSVLEGLSSRTLKIQGNSTRRAKWDEKLGFHKKRPPFRVSVGKLSVGGGAAPVVDVVIMRKYSPKYLSLDADGKKVRRSQQQEDMEVAKYEKARQAEEDRLWSKAALEEYTSAEEAEAKREEIREQVREKLEALYPPRPPSSIFLTLRVCDYPPNGFTSNESMDLTIWNPPIDFCEELKEGTRYKIFGATSKDWNGQKQLSFNFKPDKLMLAPVDSNRLESTPYFPRKFRTCEDLVDTSRDDEVDMAVFVIGPRISSQHGPSFLISDMSEEVAEIVFKEGIPTDKLKAKEVVFFYNLRYMGRYNDLPKLNVTDKTEVRIRTVKEAERSLKAQMEDYVIRNSWEIMETVSSWEDWFDLEPWKTNNSSPRQNLSRSVKVHTCPFFEIQHSIESAKKPEISPYQLVVINETPLTEPENISMQVRLVRFDVEDGHSIATILMPVDAFVNLLGRIVELASPSKSTVLAELLFGSETSGNEDSKLKTRRQKLAEKLGMMGATARFCVWVLSQGQNLVIDAVESEGCNDDENGDDDEVANEGVLKFAKEEWSKFTFALSDLMASNRVEIPIQYIMKD
ncbi:Breast cancer 2, early onset [Blyttiomyces sp. JEL0837]|nr:Breast cancer 2, early onset [Blyttiomyces sp. JEL0837]